jgi:hypothetical protein
MDTWQDEQIRRMKVCSAYPLVRPTQIQYLAGRKRAFSGIHAILQAHRARRIQGGIECV